MCKLAFVVIICIPIPKYNRRKTALVVRDFPNFVTVTCFDSRASIDWFL